MSERAILSQRRAAQTFDLRHGKNVFEVTVGFYPNSAIGEVFVTGGKTGSDMEAVCRDAAVLLSIAIQYGIPLSTIRGAITREQNGAASSVIGAVLDRLVELELPI
jgi:hypothetical protein